MNRQPTPEPAAFQVDRHPLLLLFSIIVTSAWGYFTWTLLRDMHPAGFFVAVPGVFFTFHTLWFLLNPFASVYDDRFEIRHTLFSNRQWYFGDIRSLVEKEGRLYVVFHDEETERLNLMGVKSSQRGQFADHLRRQVQLSNDRLAQGV